MKPVHLDINDGFAFKDVRHNKPDVCDEQRQQGVCDRQHSCALQLIYELVLCHQIQQVPPTVPEGLQTGQYLQSGGTHCWIT